MELCLISGGEIHISKLNKTDKIIYFGLFLVAFAVVFNSAYNPLNFRLMHVDSAAYITISQGIIRGLLPYRDFADNKGPLLYLFSAPGLFFGGFTGVWITEIIFMFVSVLFAFKTALFFGDKHKAFLGTVFSFVIFLSFYNIQAGSEEYSMPFFMISFYIFTKYFFSPKQNTNFAELLILGICFGLAIMVRLNMFYLWLGFCMIIFIESIIKRRFLELGKYISGFCLGILIALIPIFLYLKTNGILDAFFEQAVFAAAGRGFEVTNLKDITNHFYIIINRTYCTIPLIFGLFWMIKNYKQTTFYYYLAYTFTYFIIALFWAFAGAGGDGIHYNMMFIPFFIPALTYVIDLVYSAFSGIKAKNVIIFILFCIVFSEGLTRYLYDLSKIFHNKTGIELINAGKLIDENTNPDDTIISFRYVYIYPFTKRNIASKYFIQGAGANHIPGAKEEFISEILYKKPAIISIITDEKGGWTYLDDWHTPILGMIEKEYRLLSKEKGFNIYKRMEIP